MTLLGLFLYFLVLLSSSRVNSENLWSPKTTLPSTEKKKIAFVFLIRHNLPLEEIWQEFFTFNAPRNQFNIYVHSATRYKFKPSSIFYNRTIAKHLDAKWGTLGLVQATRLLMEAALEDDPDNYYFPLLSESCIPLYAFSKFYRILTTTGINKSIITACPHTEHGNMEEESRWSKTLENSKHLKWEHWRKSGQWIMLIQSHAKLFVSYTEDDEYWQKVPCSDEHFLPTLLATFGKDAETTCSDGFTNVYWDHPSWGSHPYSYLSEEINRNLFYNLRFAKLQPEEWSKPKIIGLNNQCAGYPGICHFVARKFSFATKFQLLSQLQFLLVDDKDDHYQSPLPPPSTADSYKDKLLFSSSSSDSSSSKYPGFSFFDKLFPNLRKDPQRMNARDSSAPVFYYLEHEHLREFPNLYIARFFLRIPHEKLSDAEFIARVPVISSEEQSKFPKYVEYAFPSFHEGQLVKAHKRQEIWLIGNFERQLVSTAVYHRWEVRGERSPLQVDFLSEGELEQIPVGNPVEIVPDKVKKKFGVSLDESE
jgi:hypothetical protein